MDKKKILIVDDEESVRNVLQELVIFLGYEAKTAADGCEAIDTIDKESFDLVVTDMHMPGMNGLELIKSVKQAHPSIDLMAITGYDAEYRYTDVIEVGASDFITKPIESNELEAKINRVFRERQLKKDLERLSAKDGLTDLYNRRYMDSRLRQEVVRASRQHYSLFLILLDIDNFKTYNDINGHQGGDRLLKKLAEAIDQSIRHDVDTGFRYGGDEMGVIAPQVNQEQALMIAHRINERWAEVDPSRTTSLSIGVAQMQEIDGILDEIVETLIKHADDALYRSKHNGGDCCEVFEIEKSKATASK
jgi:two-component system, cell cycle response regulator